MKIVKLPNGKRRVRYKVWRNGRVIRRPQKTFDTYREARDFIENLAAERRIDRDAGRVPFDKYAEAWLNSIRARDRKARTLEDYESKIGHALAYFGDTPVGSITPLDAGAFLDYLRSNACPGIKTSRSVIGAWHPFKATLKLATRQGAIPVNPADAVDLPAGASAEKQRKHYRFLRVDEVGAIADQLRAPYGLMVTFLAYTGLRAGELAGLDVRHITLVHGGGVTGRVTVEQTRRRSKGQWLVDTPKSHKSRTVPLPPWLAAEMASYLRDVHPDGNNGAAPLFPGRKRGGYTHGAQKGAAVGSLNWAEPVEPTAFYRNLFKPALKRANLAGVRLHDLRHTYASWVAADGARPEVVAKLLGHADATVTLKIYTHLWPEHLDDAVANLARPERKPAAKVVPLAR